MLKKFFKRMLITIVSIIVLLIVTYLLFVNYYPSFGGDVSKERQLTYEVSNQYANGKFNNIKPVPEEMKFSETMSLAYKFFTTKVPNGRPNKDLNAEKLDSTSVADYDGETRMIWFGHSSFLLQIENKNILIDPMFSDVPAPHPLLGAKRFNSGMPLEVEKLPQIDAVIFSHDHYDHLDYESVLKLKEKTNHFYTPLGVGVHLESWGVDKERITELDWWQEINLDSLTLACTPAQHFSGRKLNNGQSTLWSSWVITSDSSNIFFSGDSGYSTHFKEIGEKYGPFDIALMECGQYNELWSDIHMMPEETALAGIDIKAEKVMPIHWGGFKLALHDWTDPIVRFQAKADELNLKTVTPKIGEEILINNSTKEYSNWWQQYSN